MVMIVRREFLEILNGKQPKVETSLGESGAPYTFLFSLIGP